MTRPHILLFCLAFFGSPVLHAQTLIQPEQLTIEDGLSQGYVSIMLQDSEGFLWICAKNGLNRYDGEHFKVFTHDPADPYSISADFISGLNEIGDYLLVGTESVGLNIFHKRSQRFYKIPQKDPNMTYWPTIGGRNTYKDALDQIWFFVEESQMYVRLRFPENFWEVLPMEEQILQEIEVLEVRGLNLTSIIDGEEGYLIGFRPPDDMLKINSRTGEWEILGKLSFLKDNISDLPLIKGSWVTHNEDNIGILQESKWRFFKTDEAVNAVAYFENEDELCVITYTGLLTVCSFLCAFFWLVCSLAQSHWLSSTLMQPQSLGIRSLWITGVLIFTFQPHLFAQQPFQFKTIAQKDGLSNNFIEHIFQDSKGFIWVGTENGLNRYDGYQFTTFKDDPTDPGSLSGNFVTGIDEDQHGNIWVFTERGFSRLDVETNNFKLVQGLADSMPVESVCDIFKQDKSGNIWLGSKNGLFLFNAETKRADLFKLDDYKLPIETLYVQFIEVDDYGNIWVGIMDKGLIVITRKTQAGASQDPNQTWEVQYIAHDPNDSNSISSNRITGLLAGKNGYTWIATDSGISRINGKTKSIENIKLEPSTFVSEQYVRWNNLFPDSGGKILYVHPIKGLYRIERPASNPLSDEMTSFLFEDKESISGIFFTQGISAICPVGNDWYWVGTENGLRKINIKTGEKFLFTKNSLLKDGLSFSRIKKLFLDDRQNLWISTYGGGINLLPASISPFTHYNHHPSNQLTISNNQVRSMIVDDEGYLWVATLEKGLDKMKFKIGKGWEKIKNWQADLNDPNALQSNALVHMIKARNGKIWIASFGSTLIELDPVNDNMKGWQSTQDDLDFQYLWALCEDREGSIWMGTRLKGVYKLNPNTGRIINYSNFEKWANTKSKFIYNLYEDRSGNIWVCTEIGLYRYDPAQDLLQEFLHNPDDPLTISNSHVWTIEEDKAGFIWIATNQGLNLYDPKTKAFRRFYVQDGLPSNVVVGILEDDDGYLWVSTDAGIARCLYRSGEIPETDDEKSFRSYKNLSGLMDETFLAHAYYKDERNGHLFFGGLHGIHVVQPELILSDTTQPRMKLSSFSIFAPSKNSGQQQVQYFIADKENIQLSYLDDIFTFTFSDLNYQKNENYDFEYQLSGLNDQWIPLQDNKTMTFIDLRPGSYSLNMRGKTAAGKLTEEKKLLDIQVSPPWWKSYWAYSIYLFATIGLLWLAYHFQLNRQLEKQESQRLKELDGFKSRLYTNITHEFRTPLTVISGIAEQMKGDGESKSIIKRNSDQLLNLVNQMLDLRKLESGTISIKKTQADIIKFIRYLTESLKSYAEMKGLTVHFLSNEKNLLMDFDSEKMTRIHSNLLSNAIKFTGEGGNIYIQLHIENKDGDKNLAMTVRDTGVGIPKDKLPHIFDRFYQVDDSSTRKGEGTGIGLTLVSELIKAMNGSIQVTSTVGEGTTFVINLPITNTAEMESGSSGWKISNAPMIDVATAPPNLEKPIQAKPGDQSRPMILIVEDNADVIHYLIKCLKDQYTIEIAMNGQEGIEKAIGHVPDIIVSDIMMPVKDGLELCQTLKTDERTSHIPITLLTAKADIDSRLEGLERGADAYLSKPFHQEELLITLQKQLELRKKLHARFSQLSDHPLPKNIPATKGEVPPEIDLDLEDAFLKKIRTLVEKDLSDAEFGMPQLVRGLGMSRSQVYKKVKALTGHSPSVYINSIRLYQGKKLLQTTDLNVSEIAYDVGFSSPAYFSKLFLEEFGISPSETRN